MNRNVAFALWILLPFSGIICLYRAMGPDPRLLYLAAVTVFPAAMVLIAPLARKLLDQKRGKNDS